MDGLCRIITEFDERSSGTRVYDRDEVTHNCNQDSHFCR